MHTCRTLLRPYGVWRLLALAFEDDLRISHYQTQVQMSPVPFYHRFGPVAV